MVLTFITSRLLSDARVWQTSPILGEQQDRTQLSGANIGKIVDFQHFEVLPNSMTEASLHPESGRFLSLRLGGTG
jgi:hypothetical protein